MSVAAGSLFKFKEPCTLFWFEDRKSKDVKIINHKAGDMLLILRLVRVTGSSWSFRKPGEPVTKYDLLVHLVEPKVEKPFRIKLSSCDFDAFLEHVG